MDNATIKLITNKWYAALIIGIPFFLALITFFVYYPTLCYGFVFDDFPTITNYLHVRELDFAGQFFANPRWISRLLNQITFHLGKTNPFAYRIVDIVMHVVMGVLVFTTLFRLFNYVKNAFLREHSLAMASITTMLFLLHPVQTQTVTYITQMRLEGLMLLFALLVIMTFVFAATSQANTITQKILYGLSFILSAFSCGTKEIVIVLPILLILIDWFFIAQGDLNSIKSRWWVHAAYWFVIYGFMFKYGYLDPNFVKAISTIPVHNNRGNILTQGVNQHITLYPFIISQFKIFLHYVFIFFWPFSLSFDYEVKLSNHCYDLDVVIPILLVGALIGGAVWLYRNYPLHVVTFGFAWFFITMLPRNSIFPTTELICDYKTYPAALGMMLVLAFLIVAAGTTLLRRLSMLSKKEDKGIAVASIMLTICCALSWMTVSRNQVWRSEYDFWGDAITKAPKARGFNNYAIALWEMGKSQEAIAYFYKAIEKDDWYAEPHVNLATIYQMADNTEKALEHYKRALDIGEAHPELFNNLGMLHFANKSWAAAEYCLKQAVELRPHYSKSQINLGKLYQIQNKREAALQCYQNALKGDYQDRELYYLHGSLSFEMGRIDDAVASLEKIDPNFQDCAFLLACAYYSRPSYARATHYFEIAHKKDPDNKICTYNYAQALLNLRKYKEALDLFEQCVREPQTYPYARLHRTKCLYELGKKREASRALNELIASKPPKEVVQDAMNLRKELKLT